MRLLLCGRELLHQDLGYLLEHLLDVGPLLGTHAIPHHRPLLQELDLLLSGILVVLIALIGCHEYVLVVLHVLFQVCEPVLLYLLE